VIGKAIAFLCLVGGVVIAYYLAPDPSGPAQLLFFLAILWSMVAGASLLTQLIGG
jgi:hypothetical protein